MSEERIKKGDLVQTRKTTIGIVAEEGPKLRPIESGFDAQECREKHVGDVKVLDFQDGTFDWHPESTVSKNLENLEKSSEEE